MSTNPRIVETVELIRLHEESAKNRYDEYIARIQDGVVVAEISRIRDEEARHVQIAEEVLSILKKYDFPKQASGLMGHGGSFLVRAYLGIGLALGLGAPGGSLLLRFAFSRPDDIERWWQAEWSGYGWFYGYMTLGTVLAFAVSGWVVGQIHDRLNQRTQQLTAKTRAYAELSERDAHTGLYNFSVIKERLAIELERARRFRTPLACLMVDIDNLKEINDERGHLAGDEIIAYVANVLQGEIRVIDTASRYGGDEFFVILPVTPESGAHVVAERIRNRVAEGAATCDGRVLKTSVCVGIGYYPCPSVDGAADLIRTADSALYEAKRGGRNRTVLASTAGEGKTGEGP